MEVDKQPKSNKLLGGCTGKGFMPGKSGNPKGRKPSLTTTEVIRKILGEKAPIQNGRSDRTYREMLIRKLLSMALKGNLKAAELLLDRDDPKSLNLRHEEIIQVQMVMEIATPPEGWQPQTLLVDSEGGGRMLPAKPGGDNGR